MTSPADLTSSIISSIHQLVNRSNTIKQKVFRLHLVLFQKPSSSVDPSRENQFLILHQLYLDNAIARIQNYEALLGQIENTQKSIKIHYRTDPGDLQGIQNIFLNYNSQTKGLRDETKALQNAGKSLGKKLSQIVPQNQEPTDLIID